MKKIILSIALFAAVSANAQNDGFFTSNYNYGQNRESTGAWDGVDMPAMITHGRTTNQPAPLGSGLLVLAGLGVAYAMRKKN